MFEGPEFWFVRKILEARIKLIASGGISFDELPKLAELGLKELSL
jgi:hypothetical protein